MLSGRRGYSAGLAAWSGHRAASAPSGERTERRAGAPSDGGRTERRAGTPSDGRAAWVDGQRSGGRTERHGRAKLQNSRVIVPSFAEFSLPRIGG